MIYQERSLGAYTDLAHLISYQLAARCLPLRRKNRALSHLSGPYKTSIRGRGIEFEEVRLYQAGDDIRAIDWRVTARTGKPHTKQFREEREKPVMVVIDQRQNMFFGSRQAMKSVLAADLAAYICWAAFHKGDRIGGLVFNDTTHQETRPRQQRKTVLQFLRSLADFNRVLSNHPEQKKRSLMDALKELKRLAKPGTQVFLISDFHDLSGDCSALLHDLARHCELVAIQTYDELETRMPPAGIYNATNGAEKIRFDSGDRKACTRYEQDFAEHTTHIKNLLGKFRIPLIPVSTAQDPLDTLQNYFGAEK